MRRRPAAGTPSRQHDAGLFPLFAHLSHLAARLSGPVPAVLPRNVLVCAGIDLTLYATSNVQNLSAALADVVLTAVLFAATGAAVAAAGASKW